MAQILLFPAFNLARHNGAIDLSSDAFEYMLTNTAPAPTAAAAGDITEISYANLSGSRALTLSGQGNSGANNEIYSATLNDSTIAASGGNVGPFRYVVIRDTTADVLIGYIDRGAELTLADTESVPLDFTGALLTDTLANVAT
mgnify:CR=1 FL=1